MYPYIELKYWLVLNWDHWYTKLDNKLQATSYIPVPRPVPGGPQEPWGSSRVVTEMAPGPRAPHAHRAGVPRALDPAGPGHGRPSGPPRSRRKKPRTPRHLGAFRGPSGGPGSFSLKRSPPDLQGPPGASGDQPLWGPSGGSGNPGGPRSPTIPGVPRNP